MRPALVALLVLSSAACRTARPSPLHYECAEAGAARARVLRADNHLYQVTLTRDQLVVATCGSAADQQLVREALRTEGRPSRYRREQWNIQQLTTQLGQDPHGIGLEAQRWCHEDPGCLVAVVVDDGVEPVANAGTSNQFAAAFNCGLSHAATGHFDLTFKALHALGFSDEQARFAATASQDVDDFEWTVPAAHAQAPNYPHGALLLKSPAEARAAFIRWGQCQLKRLSEACGKPVDERLYWLGYSVHGVQDLVLHGGMSNAEHAYRDHTLGEGVDCVAGDRAAWAAEFTSAFLTAALTKAPGTCGAQLKEAVKVTVTDELRARLGRKSDRLGLWLGQYFSEGTAYGTMREEHPNETAQYRLEPRWITVSGDAAARTRTVTGIVSELTAPAASDPCGP